MEIKKAFYRTVHGPNHHWWAFAVTGMGIFMTTYDMGAVSIGLPTVMASFKTDLSAVSWVLLSYLLTSTALLLPAGRLGDMVGRKKVFNLGYLIFFAGSALCGLSQSTVQLILFRMLQAVGAAMIQTNSFAITSAVFPDKERGKGLGLGSTVAGIGITSGPAIGGLLVDALGWRGLFFLNVPIGLAAAVLTHLVLREDKVSTSSGKKASGSFDLAGACLAAVAIGSLLIGLSLGQKGNWSGWETQLSLCVAALAMIVFPWFESRRAHPLVDIGLLKNRNFAFSNAARFICFVCLTTTAILMPFFLQLILGYSPSSSGFLIAPQSLVMAATAAFAGWLTNRISSRVLTSAGMILMGISLYGMSRMDASSGYAGILGLMLLQGFGNGIFQTPNNTSVMDSVPRKRYSIASSILALVREFARAFGASLASTIVVSSMFSVAGSISLYSLKDEGALAGGGGAVLSALAHGIRKAFFVAFLLCVLGVIFSLVRGRTERDLGKYARLKS